MIVGELILQSCNRANAFEHFHPLDELPRRFPHNNTPLNGINHISSALLILSSLTPSSGINFTSFDQASASFNIPREDLLPVQHRHQKRG